MMKEKVLVVDGGGRGSVLVSQYLKSPHVASAIAIPGNDMMKTSLKQVETFPLLKTTSVNEILRICQGEGVTLVDVAQDNAVAVDLVTELRIEGIKVIGPTREAGQIEWSKSFARKFGTRHGLPQPEYHIFSSENESMQYLSQLDEEVFVKADGLCEGKGAFPAKTRQEVIHAIKEMQRFKTAGTTFLIEEWLKTLTEPTVKNSRHSA